MRNRWLSTFRPKANAKRSEKITRWIVVYIFSAACLVFANDDSGLEDPPGWKEDNTTLYLDKYIKPLKLSCSETNKEIKIRTIIVHGDARQIHSLPKENWEGAYFQNIEIPGNPTKLQTILAGFVGMPLNPDTIANIKKEIVHYYRQEGHPVIDVYIPQQNVSRGILQVVVIEATLGEIRSIGNRYFSNERLIGYIRAKPDNTINAHQLVNDLNWMNRNSFRQTDAFFTPGKKEGTTDIELLTQDRRTWRIYTGADNTGLEQTEQTRLFTGINFGNLFNWDQMFTYQFTMAPTYHDFSAHTAQWVIPLPWRHVLTFYGGYSWVHANRFDIPLQSDLGTHGTSMQASMRWDVPLSPMIDFLHEFIWGIDWKKTNNILTFIGTEFFGKNVNLFQFLAGYNLGYENRYLKVSLTWENFFSPGQWLPQQSKADYESLRDFATPLYYYTRVFFTPTFRHPASGATFNIILRGQWSTANLLSSEEFGIGGYDTVRGYNERQLNGDYAVVANLEARTPQWPLFWRKKTVDKIQFLAFFDYGKIWIHKPLSGEPKGEYLDSIGAGMRYLIDQYLTVRVDYGYGLKELPFNNHVKWHFSTILSY